MGPIQASDIRLINLIHREEVQTQKDRAGPEAAGGKGKGRVLGHTQHTVTQP